jgi:MSHA pilin protein MshD
MCTRPIQRQAGLTMVELVMFIIIISVAVADLMVTLGNLSARGTDPFIRKQAMLRAESLLEEVSLAHFTFCHPTDANAETANSTGECLSLPEAAGHPAGETRPYLNINDYVSAYGVAAPYTTDVTGAPMLPSNLSAQVTVKPVVAFGPGGALQIGAGGEVLHILVDVAYGDKGPNAHVKLERYRTRYAPNSMP